MPINAECHSDDRIVECKFDAAPWFAKATDAQIIALAKCGWGGDYPADDVALWMQDQDAEIVRMFDHINNMQRSGMKDAPGFECHVDPGEALQWLRQHRRSVYEATRQFADA